MPRVREIAFAAIDFESAGVLRGHTDVPIQVGIAVLRDGVIDPGEFFTSYLHTDRPVAWAARKVHGISDDDLAGAPTLLDLWPELRARLTDRWIVSHGAGTEKRFLRAFPMHGFGPFVDTLTLFRAAAPDAASHALGDLAHTFGVEADCFTLLPDFRWHDALCDAVASLVLLRRYIESTHLADAPAEALLGPR